MRFLCPSCTKELAIPDEKLPPVERFSLKCPYCREKLVIDKTDSANPARLMAEPSPPPPVRPILDEPLPVRPLLEDSSPILEEEPEDLGVGVSGVSGISHGPTTGVSMGVSIVQEPAPPPEDEATVGVAPIPPIGSVMAGEPALLSEEGVLPVPGSGSAAPVAPVIPTGVQAAGQAVTPAVTPATTPVSPPASGSGPVSPIPPAPAPSSDGTGEPEIFPPGSKVVFFFLADSGWLQGARTFFQEQGYHVSTATDSGEATAKLRLNAYNVLLVEDNEDGRLLLKEVGGWSGVRRRECNVALVGEGAPSLDPQPAFRWGVNSWLNRADAGRCGKLLGEVLKGYELYYELLHMAEQQGREE